MTFEIDKEMANFRKFKVGLGHWRK